ncbi:TobH protein [Candidatus Mycobacterium methanotrophicum]|uniref:TobH protein n=1 Tax=Candidatus Mycobacterium methanotrophicum TaxID=2943498 RepID=A0ABY4QQ49_9MYCO|nr:TobH protein [Candidatus Mycobacterium methanotrophicum]UQX12382.1 TobH protein [Candidatus Mycobacterium methanotrophicum]
MNATRATIDLDDTDGLLAADRDGLLRSASTAGAQVRAAAAALDGGALDPVTSDERPRTVIWVAGRGAAETAGVMLAATLGSRVAAPIVVAAGAPPWIGPLDTLVVAGDDPGDPALVGAAASGVRRGARVVVAAPYQGPLRDSTAGRVAVMEPRVPVPEEFRLCRYLAAGLATLQTVDPKLRVDLAAMADELDAEALRNSASREVFTNPAKALVERMSRRRVVLAGDCAATLALARHGSSALLRIAHQVAAATGLADALAALRAIAQSKSLDPEEAFFHDEQIDGPVAERLRVLALTLDAERSVVASRAVRLDDLDIVGAEDVSDVSDVRSAPVGVQRAEQQLAILAVRLEMAAVYLRLVRG